MGNTWTGFDERGEMRWRCEILRFSKAQAAEIEAERSLFNGLVMQVTTEDPSNEGGREVVKFFSSNCWLMWQP